MITRDFIPFTEINIRKQNYNIRAIYQWYDNHVNQMMRAG